MLHSTRKLKHTATAGPQDAWGVDWDCNTDACDVEEIYRRNGRSVKVLEKVLDHPNATPNGIRAACYLLWRDHEKKAPLEIARKAYDAFRFIKEDHTWIQQLAKQGNIRAKLEMEMDRVKAVMRNCGSLDSVLEEAEERIKKAHSGKSKYTYATISTASTASALQRELTVAHAATGAVLEFVMAPGKSRSLRHGNAT
jgi:DNA repair ATPase RecN